MTPFQKQQIVNNLEVSDLIHVIDAVGKARHRISSILEDNEFEDKELLREVLEIKFLLEEILNEIRLDAGF